MFGHVHTGLKPVHMDGAVHMFTQGQVRQDRYTLKQDQLKQDECTFRQDRTLLTQDRCMFGQDQTCWIVVCVRVPFFFE